MGPKKILVIDDDDDSVAFVRAALAPIDVKVISAADGEIGLVLARSDAPDLILLDIFLPKRLGFHSLVDLRSTPETANIPIIMLSSLNSRIGMSFSVDEVEERFGARPDILLDKPVEPGRLQGAVRELLGMEHESQSRLSSRA